MSEIEEQVKELVENAKAPGTFSIINAIKDRAYPTDSVIVFLDEETAYKAALAQESIDSLDYSASKNEDDEAFKERESKREKLVAERDAILEKLSESKYTFIMRGISEGQREEIFTEVGKIIPAETKEERNPITGEITTTEVDDPERNKLFTDMLWANYIEKIVAPNGDIQDGVSTEDAKELRKSLPLASVQKINECIDKLRVATASFMYEVDEDFLAKS